VSDVFAGKVALVTGASHGIGEHIALGLAAAGARLVLAARRPEELARVAQACRRAAEKSGRDGEGGTVVVPTDLTDPAQCERLVARAIAAFGRMDVLVNNAGLGMWARVDEVRDLSVFERVMRVNYFGAVHCTVHALPHLKAARGRIVCVSSLAGRLGIPLRSGYAASKHAMAGFFDSLRIELRGTGVSVTLICPGFVGTGAQGRNLGADGTPLGTSPVDAAAAMTPEACARITIAAAAARRREVVIGARGKIGLWLRLLAPHVVDTLAARAIERGR
jgi:NAD(P)-dependent dehydrogenase (short-subunit alcohol dehydrogenase family)